MEQARRDAEHERITNLGRGRKILTIDEEQALFRAWQGGDQRAFDTVILAHARMTTSSAWKLKGYGIPVGDLAAEGMVGLIEAARRFDPERGIRFSTFATYWIRATQQTYIQRVWCIVRNPVSAAHKSLFFKLRSIERRLALGSRDRPRHAIFAEIGAEFGVSAEEIEALAWRFQFPSASLDASPNEDGIGSIASKLADDRPTPLEIVEGAIDGARRSAALTAALGALDPRGREIIAQRYLTGDKPETLDAIGLKFGVSKERIRQLETRALAQLKAALSKNPVFA
jgi:RNA polymerase sigma-32 factor